MALLRPCKSLLRAISRMPVSCRIEYIRGFVGTARPQGYVTVAQKAAYSHTEIEKLELTSITSHADIDLEQTLPIPELKSHLQRELLTICRNAKNGEIINKDVLQLMKHASGGKGIIDSSTNLTLLRNCGNQLPFVRPEDRTNLTNHIWDVISKETSTLSQSHYNTLLLVHIENQQTVDPERFLENMTVEPDSTTYNLLLKCAVIKGEVESVLYIQSRMQDDGIVTEEAFDSLIEAHVNNKDMISALATLETMTESGVEPTTKTYAKIAFGYAAVGDIKNTMKIMNNYPLAEQDILDIIKRTSISGLGKHIPVLLNYLPTANNAFDPMFVDTIQAIIHSGHPEDAFDIINRLMDVKSTKGTDAVCSSFLKNMVYAKIPRSTIAKYANRILTQMKYSLAFVDVCEAALQIGEHDLVLFVFEQMYDQNVPIRTHYYWPLLLQFSKTNGESGVFEILKHMLRLNVPVNDETLETYVLPFVTTDDLLIMLRKLNDVGLEISKIFSPLICYFVDRGRLKETLSLCHEITAPLDFTKLTQSLTTAYKRTQKVNDCAKMFKFAPPESYYPDKFLMSIFGKYPRPQDLPMLNDFRQSFKNLRIPLFSFKDNAKQEKNMIINESDKTRLISPADHSKSSYIVHPSNMSLEELECHLVELQAKGMNDRGVLRTLLLMNCHENNVTRVQEIIKEFKRKDYAWTPGLLSSLLQFYARNDSPEESLRLYDHLQKNYKDFKIDDFKVLGVATSLIKKNLMSEAIKLLETHHSDGGDKIERSCWHLLNEVAHSPNSESTEKILNILVISGFCKKSNVTLGPLVREHLLKNDLVAAVDTFKKCAEHYNCTPLRQELINTLVASVKTDETTKDQMSKLIKDVRETTATIHSDSLATKDLLITFARNERVDDLRKLFTDSQKNGMKWDNKTLFECLRHTPEEAKITILFTILDVSTAESGFDRVSIYKYILDVCSRFGDCQRAVVVWNKILADNIIPSRQLKKQFVNLLKMHKVPLPKEFEYGNEELK